MGCWLPRACLSALTSTGTSTWTPIAASWALTTLADELVLSHPAFGASLESASDDQVKLAVHLLFSNPQTSGLRDSLSSLARSERRVVAGVEIDYWTSPALIFGVVADNEALGGLSRSGGGLYADETELGIQEFNRNVQKVLRGGRESLRAVGVRHRPEPGGRGRRAHRWDLRHVHRGGRGGCGGPEACGLTGPPPSPAWAWAS